MSDHDILDRAVSAEYAAIYAYETLIPRLDERAAEAARGVLARHREARAELFDLYGDEGWEVPAPESAYDLANDSGAGDFLVSVERRTTAVYRSGCAAESPVREVCVPSLRRCAANGALLKAGLGKSIENPWPGRERP